MSNEVFPTLAGLEWNVGRDAVFNTKVQRSVNLTEVRAAFTNIPLHKFDLSYEFLRNDVAYNELRTLVGFFWARLGSWDSFLYEAVDDNTVVAESFGTGNATQTVFPLYRAFGAFVEPVSNLHGTPQIYKDAVLQSSGYTISATGVVTFSSAPGSGVALTWSGSYYYRCRFANDTQQFREFLQRLYSMKSVSLVGSLGTKV